MRLKWLFGAVFVWLIPAMLVGALLGALVGGRPTLIEFDNLVESGEMTQEEVDNLSEMQKFVLQVQPGFPGSERFWFAFLLGFILTEALGLAWLKRREKDSEPDQLGRLVWEILGNRRRRRQANGNGRRIRRVRSELPRNPKKGASSCAQKWFSVRSSRSSFPRS